MDQPQVPAPDKRFKATPYTLPIGKHGLRFYAWNGTRLVDFITVRLAR